MYLTEAQEERLLDWMCENFEQMSCHNRHDGDLEYQDGVFKFIICIIRENMTSADLRECLRRKVEILYGGGYNTFIDRLFDDVVDGMTPNDSSNTPLVSWSEPAIRSPDFDGFQAVPQTLKRARNDSDDYDGGGGDGDDHDHFGVGGEGGVADCDHAYGDSITSPYHLPDDPTVDSQSDSPGEDENSHRNDSPPGNETPDPLPPRSQAQWPREPRPPFRRRRPPRGRYDLPQSQRYIPLDSSYRGPEDRSNYHRSSSARGSSSQRRTSGHSTSHFHGGPGRKYVRRGQKTRKPPSNRLNRPQRGHYNREELREVRRSSQTVNGTQINIGSRTNCSEETSNHEAALVPRLNQQSNLSITQINNFHMGSQHHAPTVPQPLVRTGTPSARSSSTSTPNSKDNGNGAGNGANSRTPRNNRPTRNGHIGTFREAPQRLEKKQDMPQQPRGAPQRPVWNSSRSSAGDYGFIGVPDNNSDRGLFRDIGLQAAVPESRRRPLAQKQQRRVEGCQSSRLQQRPSNRSSGHERPRADTETRRQAHRAAHIETPSSERNLPAASEQQRAGSPSTFNNAQNHNYIASQPRLRPTAAEFHPTTLTVHNSNHPPTPRPTPSLHTATPESASNYLSRVRFRRPNAPFTWAEVQQLAQQVVQFSPGPFLLEVVTADGAEDSVVSREEIGAATSINTNPNTLQGQAGGSSGEQLYHVIIGFRERARALGVKNEFSNKTVVGLGFVTTKMV